MTPQQRVICFIDGSNIYGHLDRTFGSGKINFPALCNSLVGNDRRFFEWRFYAAPVPQGFSTEERTRYANQQKFFHFIRRHRKGVLRLGRFQRDASGILHEKGVDVLLSVDLVRLAAERRYDVAILLSGDADMVPAIETVQQLYRKRVEVAIPRVRAYHITQVANAYIEITRYIYDNVRI
jgi:uncharacterized LabA/DUF88 family protein